MLYGSEVFIKLKNERDFKNNKITFNSCNNSVDIIYNSGDISIFDKILSCYGFYETKETFDVDFDIFLNNICVDKKKFDLNSIKPNSKITIKYNDADCFSLYQHTLIHEINETQDTDYYFRKELEKWSV